MNAAFRWSCPGKSSSRFTAKPEEVAAAIEGRLNAAGKRFAIVVSRFNSFITERLLQGALDGLRRSGAKNDDIALVRVPGVVRNSLRRAHARRNQEIRRDHLHWLSAARRHAHYDVIVNEVTRGIGQSAQETGVPHAFGVLTCETLEQAIDRAGLKMGNKGLEAALAAVEMANLQTAISRQSSVVRETGSRSKVTGVSKGKAITGSKKR